MEAAVKGYGLVNELGIGPNTLEKLALAGVKTSQNLLLTVAESLAKKTGLNA